MDVYDAASLPADDNVNPYSFCLDLGHDWFLQKGAMIAYYGEARFDPLSSLSSAAAFVAARFSSPVYAQDWVVVAGRGKVVLADRGHDINSFDLEDGNLTVRAGNLLAFDTSLELKQSIVPGFLTLLGTGKFIASSNGPVIFVEPPFRADPEALLGWADCPCPSQHFDAAWMAASITGMLGGVFGRASGEERQYDFTGAGTVLLQSSEQTLDDPSLLRLVTDQAQLLSPVQAGQLAATMQARAAQQ